MILPHSMGGYGLLVSSINATVRTSGDEYGSMGSDSYRLDVFRHEAYTDLEYGNKEYQLDLLADASLAADRDKQDQAESRQSRYRYPSEPRNTSSMRSWLSVLGNYKLRYPITG